MVKVIFLLLISYLIGSIRFGAVLASIKGIDLSSVGSGNIGATNAARVLGIRIGILTALLDAVKGFCACFLGTFINSEIAPLCGLFAVLGHCYPLFGRAKGGKGVATSLGVILYVDPFSAVIGMLAFTCTLIATRIGSLSSLIGTLFATGFFLFSNTSTISQLCIALIAIIIFVRHKDNIQRIMSRSEAKLW